ncbi:AAA family ATPase [Reichenbachiella agariperforans]|uniref:AAA family ATPase n=1 Tax=Reichenbachiella agariperforans TaxID=156994 RepID=UPI001C098519|nr:AAA family ATPase [Reichenbachiella agariperforans]MBU2915371.1 AAA family ATPase [Reichenbachiella agariperforans]
MKIKKFTATDVYNYIPINLNFNDDLSIITGMNGTGKTSAIKLMHAVLCPNFNDILSIPFKKVELHFSIKNVNEIITISKSDNDCSIDIESIEESLIIADFNNEELEYYKFKHRKESHSDINEMMFSKYHGHPVLAFIKSLPSPNFLGLDRKNESYTDEDEKYLFEKRRMLSTRNSDMINKYRRQYKGSLSSSLLETEFLVQQTYARLKKIEDRLTAALKDEILLSSFEYTSFNEKFDIDGFQEKRKLLSRRKEIKDSLIKIGYGENPRFISKLDEFFIQLEALLDNLEKKESGGINIEWLINHAQIDKLSRIVEVIDDYNSKVKDGFRPLDKFLKIANSFFEDSNKEIIVNKVGQLAVNNPNNESVTIDALSSGEMQLIILFANVMLNRFKGEKEQTVFIIDEPELSLHIRWQERFIESLKLASSSTQFILATHSPDIIGGHKSKCIKVNG